MIVSELATNVLQHGQDPAMRIGVDLSDPLWWEVAVIGGGPLPSALVDPDRWTVAAAGRRSGRGLGIVRRLSDEVIVGSVDDALSIRCRRRR